jgi:transcriptional regulator with XRE-family HTH domain
MPDKAEQAQKISNNIKRLRSELDWNQAKLAQEAGISGAALSKIEGGERMPTIVVLRKLSAALKVSLHHITGEEAETAPDTDDRSREFYRRWDVLDDLSKEDQIRLRDMAERLKEITPKK